MSTSLNGRDDAGEGMVSFSHSDFTWAWLPAKILPVGNVVMVVLFFSMGIILSEIIYNGIKLHMALFTYVLLY